MHEGGSPFREVPIDAKIEQLREEARALQASRLRLQAEPDRRPWNPLDCVLGCLVGVVVAPFLVIIACVLVAVIGASIH